MPGISPQASRAPFDTATFILPAEWHTLGDLLGADTGLLMLQDGQIQQFNPALAALLEYDTEELAGQPLEVLLPEEEAGRTSQLAEGRSLLLRSKWGGWLPFEVLENRIDTLSEGRWSLLVLRPLPAPEPDAAAAPGARLLAITEQLPDLVLVCDSDAGIRYANKAFGQLAGAHGEALLSLVHHDDRPAVAATLEQAAGSESLPLEMRIRRAEGGWSHVSGTVVNLLSHPDVQGLLVNVRDVSAEVAQRQRHDSERKRQLHYLTRLLRLAQKPQPNLDSMLKVIVKSSAKAVAAQRCAYWEAGEDGPARCVAAYDDTRQNFVEEVPDVLAERTYVPLLRRVQAAGETLALDDVDRDPRSALYCEYFHAHGIKAMLMAPVMRDRAPAGVLVLGVYGGMRAWRKDETEFAETVAGLIGGALEKRERSRTESRLRDLALEDSLSGPVDGALLRRQAADMFPRLAARAATLSIFLLEIEGLTEAVDRHGYLLGDELLKAAALRLKNAVRREDVLLRLDVQTLLLLACDLPGARLAQDIAQQIVDSMRNAFSVQGKRLHLSIRVGLARYPDDGAGLDALLGRAAASRYQARTDGTGQARPQAPAAPAPGVQEHGPSAQLRRAVEQRELRHYYQPQIDLRNGRVRGVEVLLRWQHPQHGLLLPASFLPLAERSGDIRGLTAWALDDACRQAAGWSGLGLDGFTVSLKLSAAQLADQELLPALGAALRRHGLPPHQLECEIKDSVLRDAGAALLARLQRLAELGVQLAVDEIGGQSLDELLRRCPLHRVKIDASPAGGAQENDASALVEAALANARRCGLEVVAKGVETSQQAEHLRHIGCDVGQGYYYTQPLTPDQLEKWLTQWQANRP